MVDIDCDKGDNYYHNRFFAKHVLITAFCGVHVKD